LVGQGKQYDVVDRVDSGSFHPNTANYRDVLWCMVEQVATPQECQVSLIDNVLCKADRFSISHIQDAFVEMWCCCRKHDDGGTSSAATGPPTAEESYGPEADRYDVKPPTVDDATSSVVNSSVLNKDIRPNENDGNEANTSWTRWDAFWRAVVVR